MPLTEVETEKISQIGPGETVSAATAQFFHSLFFLDGKTVDNIVFPLNVYYDGDCELISVRDWDKNRFQIVHDVCSAVYPPKLHLPEIKSGVGEVLNELKKGNDKYKIIKTVPKARQLILPDRYVFSHDLRWYETLRGYVSRNRVGISNQYFCDGKWNVGDTFHGNYTLPEDIVFLERFLTALQKL